MTIISPALVTSPCSITLGLSRQHGKIRKHIIGFKHFIWGILGQGWLKLGQEKMSSLFYFHCVQLAVTRCVMLAVMDGQCPHRHQPLELSFSLGFFSSAAATQGCAHLWTKVGWSVFWIIFYWSILWWPWSMDQVKSGVNNFKSICEYFTHCFYISRSNSSDSMNHWIITKKNYLFVDNW